MIKLLRSSSAIFSVCFLLVGCFGTLSDRPNLADPKNPSEERTLGQQIVLRFDENGRIVPLTKEGIPYVECGRDANRKCSLYRERITITDLETITILRVVSKASPGCETIEIGHGGQKYKFDDPFCGQ